MVVGTVCSWVSCCGRRRASPASRHSYTAASCHGFFMGYFRSAAFCVSNTISLASSLPVSFFRLGCRYTMCLRPGTRSDCCLCFCGHFSSYCPLFAVLCGNAILLHGMCLLWKTLSVWRSTFDTFEGMRGTLKIVYAAHTGNNVCC